MGSEMCIRDRLVTIDDGSGEMTFPIWEKVLKHIQNSDNIIPNNRITYIGKVDEYKGKLQVVPDWGQNVWVESAEKSTPEKTVDIQEGEVIKLVELDDALIDEIVTVKGEVTNVKEIKGGILVTIRQGDEYMTTPFWNNVLKDLNKDDIETGINISITGKVDEYKGKLQVVPRYGSDVSIE